MKHRNWEHIEQNGKSVVRVLEAALRGCSTSLEISEETGLSIKEVSSWVSQLVDDGLLRRTGRTMYREGRGARLMVFETMADMSDTRT